MIDIQELGEESGREEAAEDYDISVLADNLSYRALTRYGRARAQGLYDLRGRDARVFAQSWANGYQAHCEILKEVQSE